MVALRRGARARPRRAKELFGPFPSPIEGIKLGMYGEF